MHHPPRGFATPKNLGRFQTIIDFCFTKAADGSHTPVRAPPVISRGSFALCNTPVICSFLGKEFGWSEGLSAEERATIDQILSVVLSDAVGEGRLAFHPRNFYASHKTQVGKGLCLALPVASSAGCVGWIAGVLGVTGGW